MFNEGWKGCREKFYRRDDIWFEFLEIIGFG